MSNKIITKPISNKDIIDKSRHITGFNRWARSSQTIGFFMLLLEWFTIPFEVIFRRDFGQRWLTAVNFFAGGFLLTIFLVIQSYWKLLADLWAVVWDFFWKFVNPLQAWPAGPDQTLTREIAELAMAGLLILYLLSGFYQIFKVKWRNQANIPLHSFDDGTSRLLWLGGILRWIFNFVSLPFLAIFWLFIPIKQRRGKPFPKLINDRETFTNVVLEPGIIIFFAFVLSSVASFYLFVSGFAVFFHAQRKEMARKSKVLDFQDSKIEAQMMKELRNAKGKSDELLKKAQLKSKLHPDSLREKARLKTNAQSNPILKKHAKEAEAKAKAKLQGKPDFNEPDQYPTLLEIIEEMNSERANS